MSNTTNPLKLARLSYGFTQEQLANKMEITRQIVLDAEQGLYHRPPPSIVAYLANYDTERKLALIQAYERWVTETRKAETTVAAFQMLQEPPTSFSGLCVQVGGSVRGFCRLTVLQRSIVTGYIDTGHRWGVIAQALEEIGLSDSYINLIKGLPR